jgi:hypothetical protein
MKHVLTPLAAFLLLSSHAIPPGYVAYGYEVVQTSPSLFGDVLGVRDLHQTGMIVRVDPQIPPPNLVNITTRQGLNVILPVNSYGPLGNNLWSISTAHVQVICQDGPARLVAASTTNDSTYRGKPVRFR